MSVCILNLRRTKGKKSFFIRINDDRFVNDVAEKNYLNKEIIETIDNEYLTFPLTSPKETNLILKIFTKSIRFSEIGSCNTGEIDMTFCKKCFSNNPKDSILHKGAIIDRYVLRDKMSQGKIVFIDEKILFQIKKNILPDFKNQDRIVLQGITGVNENIRLKMMLISNAYCANSLNYLTLNKKVNKKYLLGIFNSKLLNFIFKKFSTNSNVNGYEIDNLPVILNNSAELTFQTIVDYILFSKSESSKNFIHLVNLFEYLIDAMVYELYLEEEVKASGCEVIKHLTNLPEIKDDWSDENKLAVIEKVYKELSGSKRPVSMAMFKMDTIEEIRIIEGKQ